MNNHNHTVYAPYTTTGGTGSTGGITLYPNTSAGHITLGPQTYYNNQRHYVVFDLPSKKIPELVFVNGILVSVGVLGSSAECAFAGKSLIFDYNVVQQHSSRKITITLQYKEKIYHYCVEPLSLFSGAPTLKEGTMRLDAKLISIINRE